VSVVTTQAVKKYLNDLVAILYQKEYFGFEESALEYVDDLLDDIIVRLPHRPHKPAPPYFDRYGKKMYYASFVKNKQTTWYAFFTKYNSNGEVIYLIRYITNSHVAAQHFS
jgi:hypothetical protein